MKELDKRGWIKKIKKKLKGKPVVSYSLKRPLEKILEEFELEKINEMNKAKENLNELKRMVDAKEYKNDVT